MLEAAGWEMRLWTEGDINERNFPITLATLERGRAFHQLTGSNVYSMLVDLMKYEVLFRHGGLYLDTNVELFKDITPLFHKTLRANKEVFMVADPGDSRFFSAGIFGALTPGASVFRSLFNDTSPDGYLQNIDFGKRCIANAITGPVWLSHIIRANDLSDTILRLDRDVAYPLGCGENEFDTCVKQVTHEDAKNDPGMRWMMNNGKAVDGSDLDGTKSSFTKYVTQTWRRVTSGNDDWNPLSLSNALVEEADGTFWKTTLPCTSIASAYPQSYAIDHFSFHGASWQDGCTNQERQAMVVEWLEKNIPADEDLVHKWALSFVRVLSSEATSSLVTRVRLHETEGVYRKARLVLASSPLRGGASLLGEALATSSNHPTSSTLWERDGHARTDSFFANYITLGDWWSVDALPDKDDETSWRSKLRKYLQDIGVKEATIDASLSYPGEFVNEVLSRAWEAGVDKVYVSIIGAHIHSTPETSKHSEDVLSAILDAAAEDPVLLCLSRENKLDMYASSMRAVNGVAPFQQIRADCRAFRRGKHHRARSERHVRGRAGEVYRENVQKSHSRGQAMARGDGERRASAPARVRQLDLRDRSRRRRRVDAHDFKTSRRFRSRFERRRVAFAQARARQRLCLGVGFRKRRRVERARAAVSSPPASHVAHIERSILSVARLNY